MIKRKSFFSLMISFSLFIFLADVAFAAAGPRINSIIPNQAPSYGGAEVVIEGANFESGASVKFGSIPAQNTQFISSSKLIVTTPLSAKGVTNLTVTNPSGKSGVVTGGFTFNYNGDGVFSKLMGSFPSAAIWGLDVDVADVDGDGDNDVAVATSEGARLFVNNGMGILTDVTATNLPNASGYYASSITFADINNDGFNDIFVTFFGEYRLYKNTGNGTFIDISTNMPFMNYNNSDAAIGDVDGDGDVDIFVSSPSQCMLYINDGNGTFTDKTITNIPVNHTNQVLGCTFGDIDNDNDIDIVIATAGYIPDILYINNGNGVFTQAPVGSIPQDNDSNFCPVLFDVDKDGDLDIFVTNYSGGVVNRLYINNGNGTFNDATATHLPIIVQHESFNADIADIDGDGDLDIVVAEFSTSRQNILYINDGTGHFSDGSQTKLPLEYDEARGVKFAEIDNDGDMDIVFVNFSSESGIYINNKIQ